MAGLFGKRGERTEVETEDFKTGALSHSATLPYFENQWLSRHPNGTFGESATLLLPHRPQVRQRRIGRIGPPCRRAAETDVPRP
jgi:hypothetical protein